MRLKRTELSIADRCDINVNLKRGAINKLIIDEKIVELVRKKYQLLKSFISISSLEDAVDNQRIIVLLKNKMIKVSSLGDRFLVMESNQKVAHGLHSNDSKYDYYEIIK